MNNVRDLHQLDFATIIFASRIHSIGEEMKYIYDWGKGQKVTYIEELTQYIPDFSKPPEDDPEFGDIDYNSLSCPRYKLGKEKK